MTTEPASNPQIHIDLQKLRYEDGDHVLEMPVSWLYADVPSGAEVEIIARDVSHWTTPAYEAIDAATRERILDQIAERYSVGPKADIVDGNGALLRGVSRFKFYRQLPPKPSRYYEIGRFLSIPMLPTDQAARPRYVLDISGIREWTEPRIPLTRAALDEIVARLLAEQKNLGVYG